MLLNFIQNTAKMDEREMKYLPQNIRIKEIKKHQPGVLKHFNLSEKRKKLFRAIIFYVLPL